MIVLNGMILSINKFPNNNEGVNIYNDDLAMY